MRAAGGMRWARGWMPLALLLVLGQASLPAQTVPSGMAGDTAARSAENGAENGAENETENAAAQYLFRAANAERAQHGLQPLRWKKSLAGAAEVHARAMAQREQISHQFAGEPELPERARSAGVRFSVIAENVAEAPSADEVQQEWMHSPKHRANILDPRVNEMGVGVARRGEELYAVDDFDRSVGDGTRAQQEAAVAQVVKAAAPSITILPTTEDARRTCAMQTGYAGRREPWFVMRYTAADLGRLPDALRQKLAQGKYHQAQVGACTAEGTESFSAYRIAVMLYP